MGQIEHFRISNGNADYEIRPGADIPEGFEDDEGTAMRVGTKALKKGLRPAPLAASGVTGKKGDGRRPDWTTGLAVGTAVLAALAYKPPGVKRNESLPGAGHSAWLWAGMPKRWLSSSRNEHVGGP